MTLPSRPDQDSPSEQAAGLWRVGTALLAVLIGASALAGAFVVDAGAEARGPVAGARDRCLIAAGDALERLVTMDYHHVDRGLERWKLVSTGSLRSELERLDADARARIARAEKVSTGRLIEAGVVALDADAGTARVIGLVEVAVRSATGGTSTRNEQYTLDLVRTGQTWLVSRLTPMGVPRR